MKKVYRVRKEHPMSAQLIGTDAEAAKLGKHLEHYFPDGEISPEDFVEVAKDPKNYLHKFFEWDNKAAAHKWRVSQARTILNCVVVVIENEEIPAYHSVQIEGNDAPTYQDVFTCLKTPDLWEQVLHKALSELERWSDRYASYKELTPVIKAIAKAKKEVVHEKGSKEGRKKRRERKTGKDTSPRIR